MKIYVNRIPFEGLHEDTTYDPASLDIDRFDVHPAHPITISSFMTKADRELIVQANIRGVLHLSCARCLKAFDFPLQTYTTLSYAVEPTDVVDITEDIRQEILLAYPMIPMCERTCKGLCRICGNNLNEGRCACQQAP